MNSKLVKFISGNADLQCLLNVFHPDVYLSFALDEGDNFNITQKEASDIRDTWCGFVSKANRIQNAKYLIKRLEDELAILEGNK